MRSVWMCGKVLAGMEPVSGEREEYQASTASQADNYRGLIIF